jgi:hypothetical protein
MGSFRRLLCATKDRKLAFITIISGLKEIEISTKAANIPSR